MIISKMTLSRNTVYILGHSQGRFAQKKHPAECTGFLRLEIGHRLEECV